MLNTLTCDMKAELCLSISTHINTHIDSTVRHLLSMIQASLQAACLHTSHMSTASSRIHKLGYIGVLNLNLNIYWAGSTADVPRGIAQKVYNNNNNYNYIIE